MSWCAHFVLSCIIVANWKYSKLVYSRLEVCSELEASGIQQIVGRELNRFLFVGLLCVMMYALLLRKFVAIS